MVPDELIKACQKGKTEAQGELYRLFYRKMYGVCLYYSKDETEAMDHLQDGFIHLFQKIKKYSFQGSFEGWTRRVFVNLILQKYRSRKLLYPTGLETLSAEDFSYESIIEDITAADLLEMVRELSPQYRLVFNLFAIEGFSHKEIAEKLNITEGTSKSNLSRARTLLQEKVRGRFPESYRMKSNGK